MKDEKLELTEKDLHCIARHLENEVMQVAFKGNREALRSCQVCDYIKECEGNFTHVDTFIKLSKMTNVEIFKIGNYKADETKI
ncbi:hypothetical protein HMPREF3081_06880 [Clostridium sp. HMSC19D02]|uniref:hypothetical protein n=1 Tax=Clostridioides TaxID=1870884 RepID=UPI0007BB4BA1|nr:hypothetical protein [Clostridioides difficile]MCC0647810.1 hypothetical protein [Clostridioides sp. ZZV15-6598]OFU10949.1 hypothetical protein HMPREF3081_06880 [Clostridium sp. HMSC19D02]EGT3637765.1 hypothetical protein [Clostridioides difficile]EGT5016657.1 hypothetical protein [Clostridioides difficile]EGT5411126.1 hypothetical protein [Clostridioides difficile]